MKKTIKKCLTKTKKSFIHILGIVVSMLLMLFGIWQHDLITAPPVWWSATDNIYFYQNIIAKGYYSYAEEPFQCFLWKTTIGRAYDVTLFLIFISWWILFFSLYFWGRKYSKLYSKILKEKK